jgi:AraC-like DNA-binding protein
VTVDWIHLVTLVGAVQGFLLAGALGAHQTNRTANRLLAVLIATFTVYLIEEVYYSAGLVRVYPQFFGISYPLPWVFGPLGYLYAVCASDGSRRLRVRDAAHFAPLIIVLIVGAPIYLMNGADKIALFDRLQSGDVPTSIRVLEPFKYVSGIVYSFLTVAHLRQHRRRIQNSYSSTERVNLLWLLWLSAAVAAIWLLAIAVDIASTLPIPVWAHRDDLVSFAIALLVYAIGYMGLRQPEIFRYDGPAAPLPSESDPALATLADRADIEAPAERYERSGLRDAEADALKESLIALMAREHPYRDPDLTLPDLAERLGTTAHKLSEVLNAELSQTFYDFVNSYRVEDVRRRLAKSDSRNQNLLTLAMDAGFASKSTFNQVFKKQTGQTPSAYRQAAAG